jgi:hypothetical protein
MLHFDFHHVVQHVTFRLADSLPTDVLARLVQVPIEKGRKNWQCGG